MTKKEFHERVIKNPDPNDGWAVRCKYLYDTNNVKSLFTLTGIDFKDLIANYESNKTKIKSGLDQLTDEERYEIISEYCLACGSKDKNCQCWNDE